MHELRGAKDGVLIPVVEAMHEDENSAVRIVSMQPFVSFGNRQVFRGNDGEVFLEIGRQLFRPLDRAGCTVRETVRSVKESAGLRSPVNNVAGSPEGLRLVATNIVTSEAAGETMFAGIGARTPSGPSAHAASASSNRADILFLTRVFCGSTYYQAYGGRYVVVHIH